MSIFFWKNLLKCLPTSSTTTTAAASPLPLNMQQQEHTPLLQSSTTTTTASSILLNNLNNSIYDLSSASTSKSLSSFSSSDSDSDTDSPLDFAAIFASQRFFFSSPGRSNSIIETPEILPESAESHETELVPLTGAGGVAVKKYSPDPYADFKQSMQEMIEARKLSDVKADWDYLHELLSCYLSLNPKHSHKFIISAFADIIVCLLSSSSSESDTVEMPEARRQHNVLNWLV